MKKRWIGSLLLSLTIWLQPMAASTHGMSREAQRIKQYFSGQRVLVTYRNGGPVYGTMVYLDVHLCPSGKFKSFGQSKKQTVLGNEQVNNWSDYGRWDVVSVRGQTALTYVSATGGHNMVPIRLLPDGRLEIGNGLSIQPRGRAQCR